MNETIVSPNPSVSPDSALSYGSGLFPTKGLDFRSGRPEVVVVGGRDRFPVVGMAFDDARIKQILCVGWGSQGPAQAQNLRDTLKDIGRPDIKVCVGLRPDSRSIPKAIAAGFDQADGALGDPYHLASKSDLVICLVSDGGMVDIHKELFKALKPGAIVGFSHGFFAGYLKSIGQELSSDHDFIMVAPKGMGPSVRKLYLQGFDTNGAGINCSVAVQARSPERFQLVQDVANAWSVGIGAPITFGTTFLNEVTSDLFGERSMLLGGLWGMSEALFGYFSDVYGKNMDSVFELASSGITGTITDALSKHGILPFYLSLAQGQRARFMRGYEQAYSAFREVMTSIYADVRSFREIGKVIEATKRLSEQPMSNIEAGSLMWQHARTRGLYGKRVPITDDLAFAAGVYVSGIMAQLHTLLANGHNVSEVVNESFIEAVDSLTPYMDARGVAYMVDNCSTTARLGTRLWGPVFRDRLSRALRGPRPTIEEMIRIKDSLFDGSLHRDIQLCMDQRPPVRISIPLEGK
ncbi:MAG: ketol-acid reductoisomerase [Patescibacteria group bacterium]|nr:ketol-acid reductoisomerase [Patescibacteria group bacterium]